MNKILNFYKFIIEKVQEDWFEKNSDFYLSRNINKVKRDKESEKSDNEKDLLFNKELKNTKIEDIKFKFHGTEYIISNPESMRNLSIIYRNDIFKFYNKKCSNYKIIIALVNSLNKDSYTIERVNKNTVNDIFKYTDEYYSIYYMDKIYEYYVLFLTKNKDLFTQEIKEIKESDNCKILYFNNKTKGKELTDYETIELNKIKNKLKNISYNDISFIKNDEIYSFNRGEYKPIILNQDVTDKMLLLGSFRMKFEMEKSEVKKYFGHLKNRCHLQGSIGKFNGIGLGYKIYKSFLKFQGYLTSDEQTSTDARKMYYNLMKDEDVYYIIDRDVKYKGQSFSPDSEKILLLWKDNPKLEQIVRIVREEEKRNGRHYEYDKELQKYLK